ncbi:EmrB/QacA subfamily drug resistance transporter [Kroppenstedtia sanguinis]|uniref:DHA2 family efflux MFS transporter permease subunit n=1 Tax=Kroppenstedtia sanguinis TaxID=1380684 RepID=UPI003D1B6DF5
MSSSDNNSDNIKITPYIPLLSICMMGMFLAIVNQTVLNVAIPRIINDFGVTANTAQWLVTGYMLVNGVLIPISAFLMETFGTRKLFTFSLLLFTVGSLICGMSPNFPIMLVGRLIQAAGAGVMMPLVMNLILIIFPPEIRGRGMGILGLGMIFAPAVGPTLSGWLLQYYSWRVLFYGMFVLTVVVTILAFLLVRDIGKLRKPPVDLYGMITSVIGFGAVLYGISEAGSQGWSSPAVVVSLVLGIFSLILFIHRQLQQEDPLLNFRVFKYDMFTLTTVINAIITLAMFAGMFLLPIYLQNLRGFTPLESGILMLPGALIMGIMSPISGFMFDRIGPRPLAIVGLTITGITTWELTQLTLETSYTSVIWIYTIRSLGMSLLMMPIMTAGLNQLPEHLNSHGNAMSNTIRQMAGSMGTALLTTIYTNRMGAHLAHRSEEMNLFNSGFAQSFQEGAAKLSEAMGVPLAQAQELFSSMLFGEASKQAAVSGINDAFVWAVAFICIGFVLCLFVRDVRKDGKKLKPLPQTTAEN